MYEVSNDYLEAIKSSNRIIRPRVLLGGIEFNHTNIVSFSIENNLGTEGLPSIGGTVSSKLNLKIIRNDVVDLIFGQVVDVYLDVEDKNGVVHPIPLGAFEIQVDNIKKTELTIELECLDLLAYYTDKPLFFDAKFAFPTNGYLILKEIENHTKLFLDIEDRKAELEVVIIKEKPHEEVKIRAFIALIAEAIGSNAIINREGRLKFKGLNKTDFKLTTSNYKSLNLKTESESLISRLIIEKGYVEKNDQGIEVEVPDIVVGDTGGFVVRLENEYINDKVHAEKIFSNASFPLKYFGYELEGQAMPHLDVGDIITVTTRRGTEQELILVSHEINFSANGLKSVMSAESPSKDIDNTANAGVSITDTIHKEIEELKENIVFYENDLELTVKTRTNTLLQQLVVLSKDKDSKAMISYSSCLESLSPGVIEFLIENNGELEAFKPKKTIDSGMNIISFEMPLRKLRHDIANKVEIRMFCESAKFSIMPQQQQVIIRGTKIESGGNKDLPFAGGEHIEIIKANNVSITVKSKAEAVMVSQIKLANHTTVEKIEIIKVSPNVVIGLKGGNVIE